MGDDVVGRPFTVPRPWTPTELRTLLGQLEGGEDASKRLAFALIKPDAVAEGKVQLIIEYFRKRGLLPLHARVCTQTHPIQFEELYKYNLTLSADDHGLGKWWLNSQIYGKGPVVTLLLTSDARLPLASLHGYLSSVKGPSNPFAGRPGQARFDLRGSSRPMNLIHSSDSNLDTLREFLLFHDFRDYAAVAGHLATSTDRAPAQAVPTPNFQMLPRSNWDLGLVATLLVLKARLLHVAEFCLPVDLTRPLRAIYSETQGDLVSSMSLTGQLAYFRDFLERETKILTSQPFRIDSLETHLLLRLANLHNYGIELGNEVIRVFRFLNIALDPWEALIAEAGLLFWEDTNSP